MTLAEFAKAVAGLKDLKRAGWQSKMAIKDGESVADHSYSASVIAMVLSDVTGCDTTRVVKMAMLHDLAESRIGDIIPGSMPEDEKERMESEAFEEIAALLPDPLGSEYVGIWREFCAGVTPESRIVRQADKIDMALQAVTYRDMGAANDTDAKIFVNAAKRVVSDAAALDMLAGITSADSQHAGNNDHVVGGRRAPPR